jgi:hypothetical protein
VNKEDVKVYIKRMAHMHIDEFCLTFEDAAARRKRDEVLKWIDDNTKEVGAIVDNYIDIPIMAAKAVAEMYDKDQVIIVAWDNTHRRTHVTTYGKGIRNAKQAAQGGNKIRRSLGFPEEMCHEQVDRDLCGDDRELKEILKKGVGK